MDEKYYKQLALMDAVSLEEVDVVKALLHEGIDPNFSPDAAGVTALHIAAQHTSIDIMFLLLEAGGNPELETEEGDSVFDVAEIHAHPKILELLAYYRKD